MSEFSKINLLIMTCYFFVCFLMMPQKLHLSRLNFPNTAHLCGDDEQFPAGWNKLLNDMMMAGRGQFRVVCAP